MARRKLTDELAAQILFASDHVCCICRERGKDVQIHHIDSNPERNVPENLAVVCLDCHSRVTGTRGLGRSYTPTEVVLYKQSWEQFVLEGRGSRGVRHADVPHRADLVSRIDLMVTELLARPASDERTSILLEQLNQLHLYRGSSEVDAAIVEGLNHVALMTGLSGSELAQSLPELLWHLCWHFPGPEQLEMDDAGRQHVLSCLDALATLAFFNAGFGHQVGLLPVLCEGLRSFVFLGTQYSDVGIVDAVIDAYSEALGAGRREGDLFLRNQNNLLESLFEIRGSLHDIDSEVWAAQLDKLDSMLSEYGLVYVEITSKEGMASLSIEHPAGNQVLILPVYPDEAVTEALPLLEPDFAHYAAQWERIMVPDPADTDARGFYVEAIELPSRIADPANADAIAEIAWRHMPEVLRKFFGGKQVRALSESTLPYASNASDFLMSRSEAGIDRPD